jgi:hypothetical protein
MVWTNAGLQNNGVTPHYNFLYWDSLAGPGGPEPGRINAVINACENDGNWLSSLFGITDPITPLRAMLGYPNLAVGENSRITVKVDVGSGPPAAQRRIDLVNANDNPNDANAPRFLWVSVNYDGRKFSTDPGMIRLQLVHELSEWFMFVQNIGWYGSNDPTLIGYNIGEGSNGEALARFLAGQFLAQNDLLDTGLLDDTMGSSDLWLNIESTNGHTALWRQDCVNFTRKDDVGWDQVTGCTTLFMYYLSDQLGFTVNQIVRAGAPTLAGVYRNLTGDTVNDPFQSFKVLLDGAFPSQTGNVILRPNRDNPFPLSPRLPTTSPSNPASIVYNLQQHFFLNTGTDGKIRHVWWDPSTVPGIWGSDQWNGPGGRTSAPAAAGDLATMVYGQQMHIFYRGTDGGIYRVFWDDASQVMFWDQWTGGPGGRTSAPPAAGDPATMVYGQQQHIFYRGTDGGIYHIFWDAAKSLFFWDQWVGGPYALTSAPAAAGDPATMVYPLYQQQHIFYRGTDGRIYQVFRGPAGFGPPTQWGGPGANTTSPTPAAVGDPATMVTPWSQQQDIFYRGRPDNETDDGIYHIWWAPGMLNFGAEQWTLPGPNAKTQAPAAAGDPATMVYPLYQQKHIFYRANDGGIHHVFWSATTGFGTPDQWAGPGANTDTPAAAGDPATMVAHQNQHIAVFGSEQNIIYRGTNPTFPNGGIWRVLWSPGLSGPISGGELI